MENYMQRNRRQSIVKMQRWIVDLQTEKGYKNNEFSAEDEKKITFQAMLSIGCSKAKAEEYMNIIFGRI